MARSVDDDAESKVRGIVQDATRTARDGKRDAERERERKRESERKRETEPMLG